MDLFKTRCGCGAIVSLPSLKARALSCDACARKRSAALNEARRPVFIGIGIDPGYNYSTAFAVFKDGTVVRIA